MEKIETAKTLFLLELSDIWRRYDRVYSCWAQKHGFSTNAMTLIEEMSIRREGVEPAEIADFLGIPRQTMTATLDGLERKGIIARFPHEKDRRRKVIKFTFEGDNLAKGLIDKLHRWELEALSKVNEHQDIDAFKTVKLFCEELERTLISL